MTRETKTYRIEQWRIEAVLEGDAPPLDRRFDEDLLHLGSGGHLGKDALLDDVPNFRNGNHKSRFESLKCTNGISSGGRQALRIGVADSAAHGDHREFCHHFHNMRKRQISEVAVGPEPNVQRNVSSSNDAHDPGLKRQQNNGY